MKHSPVYIYYIFIILLHILRYGDFVPRGIPGRLFTVIWILMGLVLSSLVIGAIVTSLTSVNSSTDIKLYGSKVGLWE